MAVKISRIEMKESSVDPKEQNKDLRRGNSDQQKLIFKQKRNFNQILHEIKLPHHLISNQNNKKSNSKSGIQSQVNYFNP